MCLIDPPLTQRTLMRVDDPPVSPRPGSLLFAELESGFQNGNNNTQIAAPQKATNQASESQKSTSSRVMVGLCQMMLD